MAIVKKGFNRIVQKWCNFKNEKFDIDGENKDVINALLLYHSGHPAFEELPFGDDCYLRNKPTLSKGTYMLGNYGSGKSLLMKFFSKIQTIRPYKTVDCEGLAQRVRDTKDAKFLSLYKAAFKRNGKTPNIWGFDDLATEEKAKNWGNYIDTMYEVMNARYIAYSDHNIPSHFTANEPISSLHEFYNSKIESRMYEMCNIIILGGNIDYTNRRLINK